MAQALGIIQLFWGGQPVNIKPGGTFKLGGLVNAPVLYGTQVGRSQKMEQSEADVKVVILAGDRITDTFSANVQQELQIQCDTGQVFVWTDMFRSEGLSVTSGDNSEVTVKFVGGIAVEL